MLTGVVCWEEGVDTELLTAADIDTDMRLQLAEPRRGLPGPEPEEAERGSVA